MLRGLASITLLLGATACRPTPTATTASPEAEPASTTSPTPAAPGRDPALAVLEEHGVSMRVPPGWTRTDGEHWVIVRDPAGSAGYLLYGWTKTEQGVQMLHLAEQEFGATMPTTLGELTAFPSGIRMSLAMLDATGKDGTALRTAWMSGASHRPHPELAGTGVFAWWRADITGEPLGLLLETINSIAPVDASTAP
jgi:hypothetical protein